jgi:hypothetical protein
MSMYADFNEGTEQAIMEHLLELAANGRELVAGLSGVPVAYDPRVDEEGNLTDDPHPFVDLSTGHRYPPRHVYGSLQKAGRS